MLAKHKRAIHKHKNKHEYKRENTTFFSKILFSSSFYIKANARFISVPYVYILIYRNYIDFDLLIYRSYIERCM